MNAILGAPSCGTNHSLNVTLVIPEHNTPTLEGLQNLRFIVVEFLEVLNNQTDGIGKWIMEIMMGNMWDVEKIIGNVFGMIIYKSLICRCVRSHFDGYHRYNSIVSSPPEVGFYGVSMVLL